MSLSDISFKDILLFFIVIITIALFVNRVLLIYSYNVDMAGIEPVFIYYIVRAYENSSIYTDFNQVPFSNCQYVPFYFKLIAKILDILKWSDKELMNIYFLSRSLNLIFNIFSSVIVGILVMNIYDKGKYWGCLFFCLSFWTFNTYYFSVRPDSLKTIFLMLAIYFYYKLYVSKTFFYHYIGFIIFATLAIYTKQDALFIVFALIVAGIFTDRVKKWTIVSAILMMTGISVFLFYYYQYGIDFVSNLSLGFKFKYSLDYFLMVIGSYYSHWLLTLTILLLFSFFMYKKERNVKSRWMILVLSISFPFTIFISFKWGASVNYYQDIILLAYLLIPIFLTLRIFEKRTVHFLSFICLSAFTFLMIDISKGNVLLYSKGKETIYKASHNELINIKNVINRDSRSNKFYLYTFEKYLCNEYPSSCLFPAYETSDPQILKSTMRYFNGDTTFFLSINPEIKIFLDTNFMTKIKDRPIFAVMPKNFDFISYYDITKSEFERIDSTQLFYIYKSR